MKQMYVIAFTTSITTTTVTVMKQMYVIEFTCILKQTKTGC